MQDFRPDPLQNQRHADQAGEDFRQAYRATTIENDLFNDDIEVELASPWQRMGAVLLNSLVYTGIVIFSLVISLITGNKIGAGIGLIIGILCALGFAVYQIVLMSREGQTFGKKLMKIRVITENGDNPGFVKYCLLRELCYNMLTGFVSGLLAAIANESLGNLFSFGCFVACVVLLFMESRNRQTLQDILAKTIVIKA